MIDDTTIGTFLSAATSDDEGDLAVASFEVGSEVVHSRRTLVLRRRGGTWRIVHLHASNLRTPEG